MQVPTLLGIGRINVTLQLPATGGLYRFSNVTYRGVRGRQGHRREADPRRARRRRCRWTRRRRSPPTCRPRCAASPRSASSMSTCVRAPTPGPYLRGRLGDRRWRTPRFRRRSARCWTRSARWSSSIPKDRISDLLDESFKAFNGAGYDLESLLDSASTIAGDAQRRVRPDARADR